jgi:hypothetical protein
LSALQLVSKYLPARPQRAARLRAKRPGALFAAEQNEPKQFPTKLKC